MKYIDYRTNEEISREQYIANGLERGQLSDKSYCGCVIIEDRTIGAYIVYCYKHDAAPELYEALKELLSEMESVNIPSLHIIEVMKQAINKAEGGKQ